MSKTVKNIIKYVLILVFFVAISYAFMPQVLDGKIVNQSDIAGWQGMAHEMSEWNSQHPDDPTTWSNSMFSGMPVTSFSTPAKGDYTQWIYSALINQSQRPVTYIIVSLIGAFLLMLSLGVDSLIAVGGAIAMTFCSYNFQIILVGHNTKMQAIAFLPWALAGLVFTYRSCIRKRKEGKSKVSDWLPLTLLGSVLFGLAVSMQVKANHQQITYYLAILIFLYAIAEFIWLVCSKDRRAMLGRFFAASALLLVMGLAGIATNANKLLPVYEYTPYSMRGGSSLLTEGDGNENGGSKGLSLDYATSWSYGWNELPNLMIPDFNGGSSNAKINPKKSETYQLLKSAGQQNLKSFADNMPLYWGPQPFTAGPMYMGAITIFLFLLGLFFCDGKEKWWLLAGTILAVLLGVGSHLMWFTKFFYLHVPFYNKFRTVSMALVALQVTLPMLGFMALDKVLKGGISWADIKKKGWIPYVLSAGVCLIFALIPSLAGSFTSQADQGYPDALVQALQDDRAAALKADAWRSFLLITVSAIILLWSYIKPKADPEGKTSYNRRLIASGLVCVLVLFDMFTCGKRYLDSGDFVKPHEFANQFSPRKVDQYILEDKTPSYRVLDLSTNTFNDSHPSYYHKAIGGYSAAKLQRYQDLIGKYIQQDINAIISTANKAGTITALQENYPATPILGMLNTKYVIFNGDMLPVEAPNALGNAWFVSKAECTSTPNEEFSKLGEIDPATTAVLSDDEASQHASALCSAADSTSAHIEMTSYAPNELRYSYESDADRLAVFSEIWYPEGWHLYLTDGNEPAADLSASAKLKALAKCQEIGILRADWTLRAAVLPAGKHTLVMRYDPKSYSEGSAISKATSSFLLIFLLISAGLSIFVATSRKSVKDEE